MTVALTAATIALAWHGRASCGDTFPLTVLVRFGERRLAASS